jgi:hypothetical protein
LQIPKANATRHLRDAHGFCERGDEIRQRDLHMKRRRNRNATCTFHSLQIEAVHTQRSLRSRSTESQRRATKHHFVKAHAPPEEACVTRRPRTSAQ